MIDTWIQNLMSRTFGSLTMLPRPINKKPETHDHDHERQSYRRGKRATQHLGTHEVARLRSAMIEALQVPR